MPRKPNFDFEKREREKAKAVKAAERAKAKARKPDPVPDDAQEAGFIAVAEKGDGPDASDR